MHHFNTMSGEQNSAVNSWNIPVENSEFVRNIPSSHHDYYESKLVFDGVASDKEVTMFGVDGGFALDGVHQDHDDLAPAGDLLGDAVAFLGADTDLLGESEREPVSVRVVWNLLENVSRVYLPKLTPSSERDTVCLSVKGDPYAVRENGVMLDALNYVRMLFSEQGQAFAAI